jgi:hypothetical protein
MVCGNPLARLGRGTGPVGLFPKEGDSNAYGIGAETGLCRLAVMHYEIRPCPPVRSIAPGFTLPTKARLPRYPMGYRPNVSGTGQLRLGILQRFYPVGDSLRLASQQMLSGKDVSLRPSVHEVMPSH